VKQLSLMTARTSCFVLVGSHFESHNCCLLWLF